MQTLSLFDVTAVHISPMQNCNDPLHSTTWRTVTIHHEGGQFEVVLFLDKYDILVTIDNTGPVSTPNLETI